MTKLPTVSLIVSTFDQPDYLRRVLNAVSKQSRLPQEILLADDGSGNETREIFMRWSAQQPSLSKHVWQAHDGFRKAHILNRAIAAANAEYLVFLDGDMVPHRDFIADHCAAARPAAFIQGHRALVEQKAAAWFGRRELAVDRRRAFWQGQISGWKNAYRWPLPFLSEKKHLRGIRGCNLAIWRADLVRVNGYNEAFVGWGREDSELAARLMNSGVHRLDVRGRALCYHLWHRPVSRAELASNDELLAMTILKKHTRCEQGLSRHLTAAR
jgi:glycosyltransferase involved in cell wall biosynthesis